MFGRVFFTTFFLLACMEAGADGHQFPLSDQESIYFEEHGSGSAVVFMHGIPSSSYLWRNVLPAIKDDVRAIAFDLPGYGQSSVPAEGDYGYQSIYQRTEKFLDQFEPPITLVLNDLGSLLGLDYATRHPERIGGIVLIEAVFMPTQRWYAQLLAKQKLMFWAMRSETIADWLIVSAPRIQKMALEMGTLRTLSDDELSRYLQPYSDIEKRRVLRYGPGPANAPRGVPNETDNVMSRVINDVAGKLMQQQPKLLLLYAEPGFIVQPEALEYAKTQFKNITIKNIGRGLHFLPEDQPQAIVREINTWLVSNTRANERR